MAYDRVEPLDPWPFQMIASTLANIWCKKKFGPEDFLPAAPPSTSLKDKAFRIFGLLAGRNSNGSP